MVLLGCTPPGRLTEQHDIFFGVAENLSDLVPAMKASWPEAMGNVHIDAWREVTSVEGHSVRVIARTTLPPGEKRLFFVNLGGYKKEEFEEFHYKMPVVAANKGEAVQSSRQTAFYKHAGFKGAASHIDDLYGVDADEVHEVAEILAPEFKQEFSIQIIQRVELSEDPIHLGYLRLHKI